MPVERERLHHNEPAIKYPTELVHRYGAKAGILMYVARELPDIPQAPMIVSEIGEPTEELLRRAEEAGIGWPRLFRSSAVAELAGYEGDFRTEEVNSYEVGHEAVAWNTLNYSMYRNAEYFKRGLKDTVALVRNSTRPFRDEDPSLPEEINVIVAEKSPSRYLGTYISLPNQGDTSLISITDMQSSEDWRAREDYVYSSKVGLSLVSAKPDEHLTQEKPLIERDLIVVSQWHDRIAQLPEMDPKWAYQIEFGIDPPCLYQVRPFKIKEKANFAIEEAKRIKKGSGPIVIGSTSDEGLLLRVVNYPFWEDRDLTEFKEEKVLFNTDVKRTAESRKLPNVQALFLSRASGLLSHGGIKQMRKTQVTALFPQGDISLADRSIVRLISDGVNLQIDSL